jgi:hypothetical protein
MVNGLARNAPARTTWQPLLSVPLRREVRSRVAARRAGAALARLSPAIERCLGLGPRVREGGVIRRVVGSPTADPRVVGSSPTGPTNTPRQPTARSSDSGHRRLGFQALQHGRDGLVHRALAHIGILGHGVRV